MIGPGWKQPGSFFKSHLGFLVANIATTDPYNLLILLDFLKRISYTASIVIDYCKDLTFSLRPIFYR